MLVNEIFRPGLADNKNTLGFAEELKDFFIKKEREEDLYSFGLEELIEDFHQKQMRNKKK